MHTNASSLLVGRKGGSGSVLPFARPKDEDGYLVFLSIPAASIEENQRIEQAIKKALRDVRVDNRILEVIVGKVETISDIEVRQLVAKIMPIFAKQLGVRIPDEKELW